MPSASAFINGKSNAFQKIGLQEEWVIIISNLKCRHHCWLGRNNPPFPQLHRNIAKRVSFIPYFPFPLGDMELWARYIPVTSPKGLQQRIVRFLMFERAAWILMRLVSLVRHHHKLPPPENSTPGEFRVAERVLYNDQYKYLVEGFASKNERGFITTLWWYLACFGVSVLKFPLVAPQTYLPLRDKRVSWEQCSK